MKPAELLPNQAMLIATIIALFAGAAGAFTESAILIVIAVLLWLSNLVTWAEWRAAWKNL